MWHHWHAVTCSVCVCFCGCYSDDNGMDVDTSDAAANMDCVLNFVKKMLAIVSIVLSVWFQLYSLHALSVLISDDCISVHLWQFY